ncbi:MAG TPA: hypothetical protein VHE54_02295 [Puia sp.]|nr:hypothetical protein [Puia sp.]
MPIDSPALVNKNILIISPQAWGNMFISKHHYAVELARRGNRVYFLNPPGEGGPAARPQTNFAARARNVEVIRSETVPDLWFIRHNLRFPYKLKFHALPLFHSLMRFQARRILRAIGRPIDIVWSFDLGYLYPFHFFGQSLKIFHPVDEPLTAAAIRAATGADVLFAVTREIVGKYHRFDIPRHFINHGVSNEFLAMAQAGDAGNEADATSDTPLPQTAGGGARSADVPGGVGASHAVRIGFSGNLLRPDIDRETFLKIIRDNPGVVFECWGSYKQGQSNIGGAADDATAAFAAALLEQPNIILHGPVPSDRLAKEIHRMDGFLICYDIHKDQSGGTNYHKIMEYLSTGKVIVSNNVTTYQDRPDLLRMVAERDNNRHLPSLFKEVITRLAEHNSPEARNRRIAFARENTYPKQLDRIAAILEAMRPAAGSD